MHFLILVLIFCAVFFLYVLHLFVQDDFVILRRNVSVDRVYNVTISMLLISLFTSRLFYVLLHPSPVFFDPLGFLVFPYYPGLSLTGALIGAVVFLALYSRNRDFPVGRVSDFISASFVYTSIPGVLGIMLITRTINLAFIFILGFYVLFSVLTVYYFRKLVRNFKDGTYAFFALIFVLASLMIFHFLSFGFNLKNIIGKENPFIFVLMFLFVILLIRNEWGRLKRNER